MVAGCEDFVMNEVNKIRRTPDEIRPWAVRTKSVLRTGEIDSDESVEWGGDAVLGQMGGIFRANCFCPKYALILP